MSSFPTRVLPFTPVRTAALLVTLACAAASSLHAAEKPPEVGTVAKDFELPDLAGGKTKLSTLTADGPVVLVVLRGFPGYQCPICNQQVGDFLGKADSFKKAGGRVVFVYPGPNEKLKEHAAEFVKEKQLPNHFSFLLDPDYTFTQAYGLRWEAKNETAYPSTFILDRERKVTAAWVSKTHGGRVKAGEALKALGKK
jgi:peroxiredoxin Q/BCP